MESTSKMTELDFILKSTSEKEGLFCDIDGTTYCLDFVSKDQAYQRQFFVAVLNKERTGNFHFKYKKDPSFQNNPLVEQVASEYVDALNKEIDSILPIISEEDAKKLEAK
jgi:hypothetical protein